MSIWLQISHCAPALYKKASKLTAVSIWASTSSTSLTFNLIQSLKSCHSRLLSWGSQDFTQSQSEPWNDLTPFPSFASRWHLCLRALQGPDPGFGTGHCRTLFCMSESNHQDPQENRRYVSTRLTPDLRLSWNKVHSSGVPSQQRF